MIVSFYNDTVSPEVVKWQKKVFDHFKIPLEQIHYDNGSHGATGHGNAIDEYLAKWDEMNDDIVIIFDIDCIPLNREAIAIAVEAIMRDDVLYGAAQHASHIPNSIDYASPAFVCFTKQLYRENISPSFKPTERGDTGAELTYSASQPLHKANGEIKITEVRLLYPTHVEIPEWKLDNGQMFGRGTTYGNMIYHGFNSRWNSEMFINKCKQVCGE